MARIGVTSAGGPVTGSEDFHVLDELRVLGKVLNPSGSLILSSSGGSSYTVVSGNLRVLGVLSADGTEIEQNVTGSTNFFASNRLDAQGVLLNSSGSLILSSTNGGDFDVVVSGSLQSNRFVTENFNSFIEDGLSITRFSNITWTDNASGLGTPDSILYRHTGGAVGVKLPDDSPASFVAAKIYGPNHLILSSSTGSLVYVSGTLAVQNYSNFDTRYYLTASSLDSRYVLTSSYHPFTASINAFSASVNTFTASINSTIIAVGDVRYATTASYDAFTGSIHNFTASFSSSVISIGDSRYVLTSSYGPFTASINAFSSSVNQFTASISTSITNVGDVRYILTSSATEQKIDSDLVLSASAVKINSTVAAYDSWLILSSSRGSVVSVSASALTIAGGTTTASRAFRLQSIQPSFGFGGMFVTGENNERVANVLVDGAYVISNGGGNILMAFGRDGVGNFASPNDNGVNLSFNNTVNWSGGNFLGGTAAATLFIGRNDSGSLYLSGGDGRNELMAKNSHLILSSAAGSLVYVSGGLALEDYSNFDTRYFLTSSNFDTRYVLTSSYDIFTGSINGFTSSFSASVISVGDERYVLTSSYGVFTASMYEFTSSVNTFTASIATSISSVGDVRYILTSSASTQKIDSSLIVSGGLVLASNGRLDAQGIALILTSSIDTVVSGNFRFHSDGAIGVRVFHGGNRSLTIAANDGGSCIVRSNVFEDPGGSTTHQSDLLGHRASGQFFWGSLTNAWSTGVREVQLYNGRFYLGLKGISAPSGTLVLSSSAAQANTNTGITGMVGDFILSASDTSMITMSGAMKLGYTQSSVLPTGDNFSGSMFWLTDLKCAAIYGPEGWTRIVTGSL